MVTTGHAYVFYVERMDPNVGLKGYAVRAWTFAPNGPFTVREDETPAQVARRLGWAEEQTWRAPRMIARRDIAYASKEKQLSTSSGFFFLPIF